MLFGNRGRRSSGKRQRKSEAYRPQAEVTGGQDPLVPAAARCRHAIQSGRPDRPHRPTAPRRWAGSFRSSPIPRDTNQTQGNQTTDPGLGVLETGNVQAQGVGYASAAIGDMNRDGSNDFLIGAPTVTRSGSVISPGTGNTDQAFLVFANRSVTLPTTQSWLSSTPEQRVGVINDARRQPPVQPLHQSRPALQLQL